MREDSSISSRIISCLSWNLVRAPLNLDGHVVCAPKVFQLVGHEGVLLMEQHAQYIVICGYRCCDELLDLDLLVERKVHVQNM